MNKKYMMFVDERGFIDNNLNENFSMSGIIFEYDYCIGIEGKKSEFEKILSDYKCNIYIQYFISKKYTKDDIIKRNTSKLIKKLSNLFKELKFNIIISSTKHNSSEAKTTYETVANNLLKKFHSFLLNKESSYGGVILEEKTGFKNACIQQNFFNIYNERKYNLNMLYDSEEKINSFAVYESNNKKYGLVLKMAHILNDIVNMIFNETITKSNAMMLNMRNDEIEGLFNTTKEKMLNDIEVDKLNLNILFKNNISLETLVKQIDLLKEEVDLKNIRIHKSQREIDELTEEIKVLKQQLQEEVLRKNRNKVIFEILSDSDVRIKDIEKKARLV